MIIRNFVYRCFTYFLFHFYHSHLLHVLLSDEVHTYFHDLYEFDVVSIFYVDHFWEEVFLFLGHDHDSVDQSGVT